VLGKREITFICVGYLFVWFDYSVLRSLS